MKRKKRLVGADPAEYWIKDPVRDVLNMGVLVNAHFDHFKDDPVGQLKSLRDWASGLLGHFGFADKSLDYDLPVFAMYLHLAKNALENFDEADFDKGRSRALSAGIFWGIGMALLTAGKAIDTSSQGFDTIRELNAKTVRVRSTITRDGRTREGYEKRPVTAEERGEVLKLNKSLAEEFPVKAQRYREIARQCDMAEGRVRYIIDPDGRRGKKDKKK